MAKLITPYSHYQIYQYANDMTLEESLNLLHDINQSINKYRQSAKDIERQIMVERQTGCHAYSGCVNSSGDAVYVHNLSTIIITLWIYFDQVSE